MTHRDLLNTLQTFSDSNLDKPVKVGTSNGFINVYSVVHASEFKVTDNQMILDATWVAAMKLRKFS